MESVVDLLGREEGKTLEFKRDLSSPDKVLRTMVAFANGGGGILVIGVSDGERRVIGLADPRLEEERLANLVSNGIEPQLSPEISVIAWRRTDLLVVEVHPESGRPFWLKRMGFPKGVFIRIGSTDRLADPAQVEELKRVVLRRSFDEEPMTGTNSEAIDFRAASELFSARGKAFSSSSFATLGLTVKAGGQIVVSTGGMLIFGQDRARWFPEAYLKAGLFAGSERSQIVDNKEFRSHLPILAEDGLRFAQQHLRQAVDITGLQHKIVSELPEIALREALINALVHADYARRGSPLRLAVFDNRVEIDNPGGLAPGLTMDDLSRGVSKLRNPIIARVFRELGLIEQWGSGIQRMRTACAMAGLIPPLFEETGTGFRVTLFRKQVERPTPADEIDARALSFIGGNPGRTTSDIAVHLGLTSRATRTRLARLTSNGLLVVVGSGPRDPTRGYYIPGVPST